jgi:hypothetical protein
MLLTACSCRRAKRCAYVFSTNHANLNQRRRTSRGLIETVSQATAKLLCLNHSNLVVCSTTTPVSTTPNSVEAMACPAGATRVRMFPWPPVLGIAHSSNSEVAEEGDAPAPVLATPPEPSAAERKNLQRRPGKGHADATLTADEGHGRQKSCCCCGPYSPSLHCGGPGPAPQARWV